MSKPSLLLYLHGFNSSPLSAKAQMLRQHCVKFRPDILVVTPQLACFPAAAAAQLQEFVNQHIEHYHIGLVGSSLGGFLATWLNQQYQFKAVLINPAVKPYELLVDFLGPQTNPYTHLDYTLEDQHIQELRALNVVNLAQPSDFWLLQQMGDEVLDYRQAVEKYNASKVTLELGGDHSFIGFERYLTDIISFLEL